MSDLHHARNGAKHRSLPSRGRLARSAAVLSGLSLAATGVAVGGGVLVSSQPKSTQATGSLASTPVARDLSAAELAERDGERVSRSADRAAVTDLRKARTLSNASGPSRTRTEDLSDDDPRAIARALMPQAGLSSSEFDCLDAIWSQESGWNVHADNPSSSAYGIPQALPGSKMSSAGPDWEDNPVTQIKWGLGYIKSRYGTACSAAGFKSSHGFY